MAESGCQNGPISSIPIRWEGETDGTNGQRVVAEINAYAQPGNTLQMQNYSHLQTQQQLVANQQHSSATQQQFSLPTIEQPPQENYITAYGMVPFASSAMSADQTQSHLVQQRQTQYVAPTLPSYQASGNNVGN